MPCLVLFFFSLYFLSRLSLVRYTTFSKSFWIGLAAWICQRNGQGAGSQGAETHINELLEVLVKVREIIPTLLVVGNELLLALEKFLSLLLKRLSLRPLVVYTRNHESILVVVGMLWVLGEKLLHGDER